MVANEFTGDFWIALAVLHHRLVTLSLQLTENEDIMRPNQRATVPYVDTKLPTDSLQQQQIHERAALLARLLFVLFRTDMGNV